jgi:PhnB protein
MRVEPYLMFDGRCEEALDFYKTAIGATVTMMMRYKDSPEPCPPDMMPPGTESKVMHSSMRIGDTTVMASDGHCKGQPKFDGITLSLNATDDAHADRLFAALSNGGKVIMPPQKTFYSSRFGMLTDKFGVNWMIIVAP